MKCPIDNTPLVMTERHGVEIDYCPQCRGVWLDRGELDKIIDRAAVQAAPVALAEPGRAPAADPAPAQPAAAPRPEPHRDEDRPRKDTRRRRDDDDDDDDRYRRPYRKRRDSFLADLFDF